MRAQTGLVLMLAGAGWALAAQPVPLDDPEAAQREKLARQVDDLNRQVAQLFQQGNPPRTLPLAEQALQLCRRLYSPERYPDGHVDLAISLNNLGTLLRVRQDLVRAEALLREALAIKRKQYPLKRFPDGHFQLTRGLANLGELLKERGDLTGAEPLYREALAVARKLYPAERFPDGHAELAVSLDEMGELLQAQGDLAAAEKVARESLDMRRRLYPAAEFPDGHFDVAKSLAYLGMLLHEQGDLVRAEPLFRECLAIQRQLYPKDHFPNGHENLATALTNLSGLLQARGEYARAEALLREAVLMYRRLYPAERFPNGDPFFCGSLSNLGHLLQVRGDLVEAEKVLRESLQMSRRLYSPERYRLGHPDLARALTNLAALLQVRGELPRAEPLFREALEMRRTLFPKNRFPNGHPTLAVSLSNLGYALHAAGDYAGAEPLLREALDVSRRLYPPDRYPAGHPGLAVSLTNLASLLTDRGQSAEAEPLMRAALEMREHLTERFLGGASEAEALNHLASLPLTRDLYLSLTRALPGADAASYAGVWRSKALLARWLAQRRLMLRASDDPDTRELTRQLAAVRQELAQRLIGAGADQAERLRRLSDRKEKLERDLAGRLPAFAAFQQSAPQSPEDLCRALPAGSVFIDLLRYVRYQRDPRGRQNRTESYVAFVLQRDKTVRRVELGPALPIHTALESWRRSLTGQAPGPEPAPPEAPPRVLRRLVWEPLARHLPAASVTVWIAPDDRLTGLPWAALPGSKPGNVLLEEQALAIVPHGQALLDGLRAREGPATEEGLLLAVGGVAYDTQPRRAGGPSPRSSPRETNAARSPTEGLRWPALPATNREVERLQVLAGKRTVRTLKGDEAGAAQLLAELPQARWAHLATHGFFAGASFRSVLRLDEKDYERGQRGEKIGVGARNSLALSGLVLAGANLQGDQATADSAILTAEAIAGLNLDKLELVVLSACETGLGEVAGGEGVFGLQRAFHIAGARNVAASLWKVDDEATAALMSLFYHNLWAEKMTPLEALRQAQLTIYRHPERVASLARERGPEFTKVVRQPAAPAGEGRAGARLWAGFVLSGPGR